MCPATKGFYSFIKNTVKVSLLMLKLCTLTPSQLKCASKILTLAQALTTIANDAYCV